MSQEVVVVGAGYAGLAALGTLEESARDVDLTLISADTHHEVKHEIHRIIRDPSVADGLAIPNTEIVGTQSSFQLGRVVEIDTDDRSVVLSDGERVPFDYLIVTVGAQTAFYGIPGLREHATRLERIQNALRINEHMQDASTQRVVVGGAGLSGVQAAGEIAELDPSLDVTIIEALDDVLPRAPAELQSAVHEELRNRGIETRTGTPIVEATDAEVILDGDEALPYDGLIWTGGITGQEVEHGEGIELERKRIAVDPTLQTSDDHIFACGDAAVIDQPNGPAPASAQAAWQAGPVAAENVLARMQDQPLAEWRYSDRGTLVSIGDTAFAHDVVGIPVTTFGSVPAATLKKFVAARWIADVGSYRRALRLWSSL